MLSALVYLKYNEHVAVYDMTLKSPNVKQRFGYVLNFFHRETEQFWRFFRFLRYYLHCVLLTVSVFFWNMVLSIYWWLIFLVKSLGLVLSLE